MENKNKLENFEEENLEYWASSKFYWFLYKKVLDELEDP